MNNYRFLFKATDGNISNFFKDLDGKMPCIGLDDRNGDPVFENDILKHEKSGRIYKAIWNDKEAKYEVVNIDQTNIKETLFASSVSRMAVVNRNVLIKEGSY